MKIFSLIVLLALLFASGMTGCLIIPTPHSDSGYARTNVVQHTQAQFVPGQTSREDVVVALGEPDAVSRDERQLAYRSEKVVALWILAAAGPGGGGGATGGTIYKNRFYVFEFDPQGRFQRVKASGQWGMVEGTDKPQLNSPVLKSVDANDMPALIAGTHVQREYPKSFWMAGVDGYRSHGASSITGQPGQLFCTESNLVFMTAAQFGNAEPALTLPFSSVTEVQVDKYFFGRRLVVRQSPGEVHSFVINQPESMWLDKPAMQSVCDFIQSKIQPVRPEPRQPPAAN